MGIRVRVLSRLILAAGFALAAGCSEWLPDLNPLPPSNDPSLAHTSLLRPGEIGNPTGQIVRMEILPVEATCPTQTPQILIATVHDQNGLPCRDCRVEWRLEGSGEIVAVDEGGGANGKGQRINRNTAISYTASREHNVTRDRRADDGILIRAGQTMCVISSAEAGDSR